MLKAIYDTVKAIAGNSYLEFTPPVKVPMPDLCIYCIQATTDGHVDIETSLGGNRLETADMGYQEIETALMNTLRLLSTNKTVLV